MGNTARSPGIHPHWLFHLPVTDIDEASARVRALGGTALEPRALPNGMRLAACEIRRALRSGWRNVLSGQCGLGGH